MRFLARLQLLTCLMVCAPCANAIMVKFGTNDGPIVPPTPEPTLPTPQPYRAPAPVWEEKSNDTPDPNAHWRPQLFIPQPRYTQIIYNSPPPTPVPLNNAQRFVQSYIPSEDPRPVKAEPVKNYFTPSQILSSQSLPGFGIRYFVPTYITDQKNRFKAEDAKQNEIATNEVNTGNEDSSSDLQWKYEKDQAKRTVRHTQESVVLPVVYQWPAYYPSRHL
ncbi:uncharacterized protein LOC135071148 [Ostrinia nubilalis]|uniref:uncharacterized protein LOC135071148 n=1 Tax=Ostrinia nubilalis TaxID=29057 RepID=UPI0030824E11